MNERMGIGTKVREGKRKHEIKDIVVGGIAFQAGAGIIAAAAASQIGSEAAKTVLIYAVCSVCAAAAVWYAVTRRVRIEKKDRLNRKGTGIDMKNGGFTKRVISRKIRFLGSVFFLLVCPLLAACGAQEEEEPVTLTFIHGWGGTVKTHSIMQEIYRDFEEQNPDIKLSYQSSSDSSIAVEKANDMLAVDKMPDIVSTNGQSYYVRNAVKREMALNLWPYIEKDPEFKAQIHPSVLETWSGEDGSIYTLPDALEIMGYWYNRDYFIQAGIMNADGTARIPADWEEFFEVCDRLRQWNDSKNGTVSVYALDTIQVIENLFLARLAGEGEEGYRMAAEEPETFDTECFRTAVTEFNKIESYSRDTDSIDNARQYFIEGKTAIYFNGVWDGEELAGSPIAGDFAYANYPAWDGKSLCYISPSSGYVLYDGPDERKKEAAVRFLKYMLSDEVQLKMAVLTGQAPSNPNVDTDTIKEQSPLLGETLAITAQADIRIKSISSVWNSRITDILKKQLFQAAQSPDALEEMIRQLDRAAAEE